MCRKISLQQFEANMLQNDTPDIHDAMLLGFFISGPERQVSPALSSNHLHHQTVNVNAYNDAVIMQNRFDNI
jgi:hypothetical protein